MARKRLRLSGQIHTLVVERNRILVPRAMPMTMQIERDDSLSLVFSTPDPGFGWEMTNYEFDLSKYTEMTIRASAARVVFRSLLIETLGLRLHGDNNQLDFVACDIRSLNLRSSGTNQILFDPACALHNLTASLRQTLLRGARVSGLDNNSIEAREGSVVQLTIALDLPERIFTFEKDDDSQVWVSCSESGGAREVQQSRELWTISQSGLESICIAKQTPMLLASAAKPSGSAVCAVCRDSMPCVLIHPCEHACLCEICAARMEAAGLTSCPVCRGDIATLSRVYISCR